jgi:hypothetical protein
VRRVGIGWLVVTLLCGLSAGARASSLDKEVIRGVIRRHLLELRHCYERELHTEANVHGHVKLQLTIAMSGKVVAAETAESTLNSAGLEQCVTRHVLGWTFPKPRDGSVVVTYPLRFESTGDE